MASNWLTPQHVRDASRVLAGLGAVLASGLRDSKLLRQAAASDRAVSLKYAADFLTQQAAGHHPAPSAGTHGQISTSSSSTSSPPSAYTHVENGTMRFGGQLAGAGDAGHDLEKEMAAAAQQTGTALAQAAVAATPAPVAALAAAVLDAARPRQQGLALAVAAASTSAPPSAYTHVENGTMRFGSQRVGISGLGEAQRRTATGSLVPPASASAPDPIAALASVLFDAAKARSQASPAAPVSAAAVDGAAPATVYTHVHGSAMQVGSTHVGDGASAGGSSKPDLGEGLVATAHLAGVAPALAALVSVPPPLAHLLNAALTASTIAATAADALAASLRSVALPPAAAAAPSPPVPPPAARPVAAPVPLPTPAARQVAVPRQPLPPPPPPRVLRERRVPESPIGRAMGFAGMGATLVLGSFTDGLSRAWNGSPDAGQNISGNGKVHSSYISVGNADRLATALSRMRGAALKIGQMLSIQDENLLPPQVQAALDRVRAGADVMPRSQLEKVLVTELGKDWRDKVRDFDMAPRAAASIGQVHSATLLDGRQVAVKIQYPGVARSIESDVDNLIRLVTYTNVLPRGLFVGAAAAVVKRELTLECDYAHERQAQERFAQLVDAEPTMRGTVAAGGGGFHVPATVPELSTPRLLTTEWVAGLTIDKVQAMSQEVRDSVGTRLLNLTLHELFRWRFMQTDPNWGNFLYDADTDTLNLIDFGAAREFPATFVQQYMQMVSACAERDGPKVVATSIQLGFLTGDEAKVMVDAHTEAGFVVGRPFGHHGIYDFGKHDNLTGRVTELGAIMLKHRLTPPPEEAYSLHRKLSGAFLACMKLKSRVPCRQLFYDIYNRPPAP